MWTAELQHKVFSLNSKITDGQICLAIGNCIWRILIWMIFLIMYSVNLIGQTTFMRLYNYGLEKGANYGWSCATNGKFVVAGGPIASYSIRSQKVREGGKVLVYKMREGKWVISQELHNPAMDHYGWFGSDVAINNTYLVVAADGYSERDVDNHSNRMGIIYIYTLSEQGDRWIRRYSIKSPKPSMYGNFGRLIHLKGDTLAVFYEYGSNFNDYADQQCLAFYDIATKDSKPFRIVNMSKSQIPIYDFSFDFNREKLIIGKGCTAYLSKLDSGNHPEPIDSINLCLLKNCEGSISSVKLFGENYIVGFHEHMYYFWEYTPFTTIKEGDSVIVKTLIDPISKEEKSFILPNNAEILNENEVSSAFFKDHSRIYESYNSRAKRNAGAGSVFIYNQNRGKLKLKQELTASLRHTDDWFGHDIAVSKNYLLVSSLGFPDEPENHQNYDKRFSGAAFLFALNEEGFWEEQKIFRSVHKKRWDKFGFSLNNWNNFFVIGSRFDDYDIEEDPEHGAIYILKMDNE